VDGNDVVAVRDAVDCALVKARRGGGPHLIEALTYRMSDHTTADDARRYRSEQELEHYRALDPVARLRAHLLREGAWNNDRERKLRADCAARVEQATAEYLAMPPQPPESMFDYLFEQLPEALREQRDALGELDQGRGHE
jgi:pyruvate dehydrogenase E1 component alpha subunit